MTVVATSSNACDNAFENPCHVSRWSRRSPAGTTPKPLLDPERPGLRHRCRRALVNPFAIYGRREERVKPERPIITAFITAFAGNRSRPAPAAFGEVDDLVDNRNDSLTRIGAGMARGMPGPFLLCTPRPDSGVEPGEQQERQRRRPRTARARCSRSWGNTSAPARRPTTTPSTPTGSRRFAAVRDRAA